MRTIRLFPLASLAWLAIGLVGPRIGQGHEGHDPAGPHGGTLAKAGSQPFEVVFARTGLKLYPLTRDQKPTDASRLSATATFYHPNSPNPWFQRPLLRAAVAPGQTPTSLDLALDLSTIPAMGAKVAFEVGGLPDAAAPSASFTVPFALPAPALAVAPPTEADTAAIAAQKVCKVSGDPLDSMGGPLKVTLGDRSTFVCCKACVDKIESDPDRYLAAPPPAPARSAVPAAALPVTVERATRADQAAINAQGVCAVSGKPLGSMGGPIKVVRGNRAVFLCCQGCVRTFQAAPDRYFGAL
jgi:hypothetical protein